MAHPVLRMLTATAALAGVSLASAQDLPAPPSFATGEPVPAPAAITPEDIGYEPLAPIPMTEADALSLAGQCPAITESSGTWLRRGLWYADVDAVVMARTWDSSGLVLMQEFDALLDQVIIQVGNIQFANAVVIQSQALGESSPGYDGAARLALGRFLFRDTANRDHTFDMIVFGGAEWQENLAAQAQLTGPTDGLFNQTVGGDQRGLHVPAAIDGTEPSDLDTLSGFNSFDRANTMSVEYASRFHNWEWNYNVAQRMRKDRMELDPSGEWVRRATPGWAWSWLAGLRYFDLEERLDWFATDIASIDTTDGDTDGVYDIDTSNNLFGLQLGGGLTFDHDRWNVTLSTKHGFFVNDARATTSLTYTDPDNDPTIRLNNYTTDLHENGVSYMATGAITGRYHLRPNISLRAGWEFMYVTGLALAPNQANFNPALAQLGLTGDAFYHGVSAGTEFFW